MKFGIYLGSRAGATCAGPADPLRIGPLVDELSGGRPFVIREYVRWCGGNTTLEQDDVHAATLHAVNHLRDRLAEAHFPPGLPIHIAEAGSPSGAHRTPTGQVSSLTALLDASAAAGAAQFELFALSDADSASDSALGTFGLCTGDYIPKPAYETYRSRIQLEDQSRESLP